MRLSLEIELDYNAFLKIIKPFYGVSEAGNHSLNIYHSHHFEKLSMSQSTNDLYLLYT